MNDAVNSPSHYADGAIECIDAMRSAFPASEVAAFCKLNAFKYIWRAGKKGDTVEDLEEAQVYLGWTIDATRDDEPVPEQDEASAPPLVGVFREMFDNNDDSIRDRARKEYEAGMERSGLRREVTEVFLDGERVPGVVAVTFSSDLHPSIHDQCGVEDVASVGSLHEAPTDRPHPVPRRHRGRVADALVSIGECVSSGRFPARS